MDQGPVSFNFMSPSETPKPREEHVSKTLKRQSTNINLRKSIQLLDDAVSPVVSRVSRTPGSGLRHSAYTPTRLKAMSGFETSEIFTFTPAKKKTHFNLQGMGDSFQSPGNYSLTTGFEEDTTTMMEATNVTASNLGYPAETDISQKASGGLFEAFKNILKCNRGSHQALSLLSSFENACDEIETNLKKVGKGVTRNQTKFKNMQGIIELLENEKNTWRLLHSLFKDRMETAAKQEGMDLDTNSDALLKPMVWALSETKIANRLFERDSSVRQSQLVVDWLETCSEEVVRSYFSDQAIAWENTLHRLQKKKQGLQSSTERALISEMDPDAPQRQKKALDDIDKDDDFCLVRNLFGYIRAGQLEKAQELCQSVGQMWRAATLEGWRLSHDSNYESISVKDDQLSLVEGNSYRDVWKAVCWRMAKEVDLNIYDRAIYAAICGNLQSLLPVCNSWMDYVWAYFKVMVEIKVEQEIRLHRHIDRKLDSLPSEFWDKLIEPHEIFKEIAACPDDNIRQESEFWYHIIQKYVILEDTPGLLEVMHSWIQSDYDDLPKHLLRLMAHIVLFLRAIGQSCREELCHSILEAYVKYLIENKDCKKLVAFYVARLSPAAQIQWYATFLEGISDQDEKQVCLALAEEEGLDVAMIAKTVVETIRTRGPTTASAAQSLVTDSTITDEDQIKINAIDWLIFDDNHRSEALKQANALMRTFIVVKKHAAAREVFDRLPSDSVEVIYNNWQGKSGISELPVSDNNAIREYMCVKAYLDAVESFNDWFNLFYQGQPAKPTAMEGNSFTDRVAMEHRLKQYEMEKERWMHNLLIQSKTTRDRIYNVMLFPDGGWLVDTKDDPEEDELRQHQMSQLRKLHLPVLCLNLHTVLHSSQMYIDAVQIADIVASELYQLYQEFDKDSMQHLLSQITLSSHCLLNDNKDPIGYEVV